MIERLGSVLPAEATTLISDSLQRSIDAPGRGIVTTLVGALIAVWSVTSAASTLMEGVTTAFDREDERSFVRRRLLSLLLAACLALSAVLVVGLLVVEAHIERWVGDATELRPSDPLYLVDGTMADPGRCAALSVRGAAAGRSGRETAGWRLVLPGAFVALLIWLAASAGFALYTAHFASYEKTWGSLAAVVVTLIWLWLTSAALLFGAEVNAEVQRVARAGPEPAPPA